MHEAEALPRAYPFGHTLTAKDHGWFSEYTTLNYRSKGLPDADISIEGDTSVLQEDELPVVKRLSPVKQNPIKVDNILDPVLCVTPEKQTKGLRKGLWSKTMPSLVEPAAHERSVPSSFPRSRSSGALEAKTSLKVRFDDIVNVKQLSPDSSVLSTGSQDPECGISTTRTLDLLDSDRATDTVIDSVKTYSYITRDPLGSQPSTKTSPSQEARSVDVRSQVANARTNDKIQTVKHKDLCEVQSDHVLARPEFSSSLRINRKIYEVKNAEIDLEVALKNKLKVSESVRAEITEKVFSKVNIDQDRKYPDLVSVHVPTQKVLDVVMVENAARVKPIPKKSRAQDQMAAPDILDFFSEVKQHESLSLTLPGVAVPKPTLSSVHPQRMFDVYRHTRIWDSGRIAK